MRFHTRVLVLVLIFSVSVPFPPSIQAQGTAGVLLAECEGNSTLSSWLNFDSEEVGINFHDNFSLGDVSISGDINAPSSFYEYIDSSFEGLSGGNNSLISTDEFNAYLYLLGSCLEQNEIMPGIAIARANSVDFSQNSTDKSPHSFHFDYDGLQFTAELNGDTRNCQNLGASIDCVEIPITTNNPITIGLTIPIYLPNGTFSNGVGEFLLATNMSGLGNYSVARPAPNSVSFSSNYSVSVTSSTNESDSNCFFASPSITSGFGMYPSNHCLGLFMSEYSQQSSLPDASIMAFTAEQSDGYGSIAMSWSMSGTILSSDSIVLNICESVQQCSSPSEMVFSSTQSTYTSPGSLTKNGETYHLKLEVCNEVGCSVPIGEASVFIQKENQTDSDGDGVTDDDDECPNTPTGYPVLANGCPEQVVEPDLDGDGYVGANDSFPTDPNEWNDTDSDGVGDNTDAFPSDGNETHDDDNDGVGNNSDAFPDDPNENLDSDSDGVGDNADPEPKDPKIRTPDDINVEITNQSSYMISGSILILAIVILFARRKQPPQDSHQVSPFVSEDSMWNE
jgi:hypothetical protein